MVLWCCNTWVPDFLLTKNHLFSTCSKRSSIVVMNKLSITKVLLQSHFHSFLSCYKLQCPMSASSCPTEHLLLGLHSRCRHKHFEIKTKGFMLLFCLKSLLWYEVLSCVKICFQALRIGRKCRIKMKGQQRLAADVNQDRSKNVLCDQTVYR